MFCISQQKYAGIITNEQQNVKHEGCHNHSYMNEQQHNVQTHEWGGTASALHSITLKVEPALSASLSATALLICGSFTADTATIHLLMSYSHSPVHRLLITELNYHSFMTTKDSGILLRKPVPGRNLIKCVAENLEVTFQVFQCMCVFFQTNYYMLVEFNPS
jgi:hypothetical protein